MIKTETYTNILRNSIVLFFAIGLSSDVLCEDDYKEVESVYIDCQDESFRSNLATSPIALSKPSISSANLNYDAQQHNTIYRFITTQNIKGFDKRSKVGLFILYSSLKISPIA